MTVSDTVGSERTTAIYRIVGVVYLMTIYPFVAGIGGIGGMVAMVLDVVMQLLTDSRYDGTLYEWGERLFMWPLNQLLYIVLNDPDSFQWLP